MKDQHFLIAKRPVHKMLGGLWELPGGKVKQNETEREAVIREISEEVSLDVSVDKKLASIRHSYSHFHLRMHAYLCRIIKGCEQANCSDERRWILPDHIADFAFPKANLKLFDLIFKV